MADEYIAPDGVIRITDPDGTVWYYATCAEHGLASTSRVYRDTALLWHCPACVMDIEEKKGQGAKRYRDICAQLAQAAA